MNLDHLIFPIEIKLLVIKCDSVFFNIYFSFSNYFSLFILYFFSVAKASVSLSFSSNIYI